MGAGQVEVMALAAYVCVSVCVHERTVKCLRVNDVFFRQNRCVRVNVVENCLPRARAVCVVEGTVVCV